MNTIRVIIKKYFTNFVYFYRHLKYRIFVILGLSILVGVLDGFGLAMFLPLLEYVAGDSAASSEHMGNLAFLVDTLESIGLTLSLTLVLVVMLIFFTLKGIFKFVSGYKNVVYKQFFIRSLREDHIYALANYKYYNFVSADAGRIQNTMSAEVSTVSNALTNYMAVLQQSVMVSVYTILAFLANPEFAMLVLIGGIITNLAFNKLYSATKSLSRKLTQSNHGFHGLLIQQVAQFKYLKATGLIRSYANKLVEKVYEIEISRRKIGILNSIMNAIREPMLIGVVVGVILIQVHVLGGSLGLIILSILFFYRALGTVMLLQQNWNKFLASTGSMENLTDFTKELKVGKETSGKIKFSSFVSKIKLNRVNFSYGDTPILKNIELDIFKNEAIAFVGESGSGKTTLLNILSGLLKPDDGEMTIDGINVKDIDIKTYQNRIGYITQEPVIFSDTIFNNVTFWDEPTDENYKRFNRALQKAQILNFVDGLLEKELTLLGNNGINLSGGQKQRISIARELYKNVDFLFMDEATSALDSETEKEIQENIENLKGHYTIVIIAHRISTIKNADRVVVMNSGCIERIGSYQQLIGESVSFKRMVELQEV